MTINEIQDALFALQREAMKDKDITAFDIDYHCAPHIDKPWFAVFITYKEEGNHLCVDVSEDDDSALKKIRSFITPKSSATFMVKVDFEYNPAQINETEAMEHVGDSLISGVLTPFVSVTKKEILERNLQF